MIERVDHIGIAVHALDEALPVWRDLLGMTAHAVEVVEEQKVRVAKLEAGGDVIELLEPTAEDSPIAKFLARRGPGIHHVCLEVDDLEATLKRFKDLGMSLIDESPRIGAGGHRIAFVHPRSTQGVLLELSERMR